MMSDRSGTVPDSERAGLIGATVPPCASIVSTNRRGKLRGGQAGVAIINPT